MDILSKLTGIRVEKNKNLFIETCNAVLLEYAGLKSVDSVIGCTDHDLPWGEYAEFYQAHELDAMAGRNYSVIMPFKDYRGENLLFLDTKVQRLDENGNCCGVSGHSVEIFNPDMHRLIRFLSNTSIMNQTFYLGEKFKDIGLSKRQGEVLFFLVRGKSAKMIAKLMQISYRTVEYYIEIIKNKCNCSTKNELIEFAINNGFGQNIPMNQNISDLVEKLK